MPMAEGDEKIRYDRERKANSARISLLMDLGSEDDDGPSSTSGQKKTIRRSFDSKRLKLNRHRG
jgi:hypothetical protein